MEAGINESLGEKERALFEMDRLEEEILKLRKKYEISQEEIDQRRAEYEGLKSQC